MEILPRLVTDDEVAAYRELCGSLARRYDGLQGAEYDDLFQEGWETVFLALRKGVCPSKDIVARRMKRWVTKCARQGVGGHLSLDEETDALLA